MKKNSSLIDHLISLGITIAIVIPVVFILFQIPILFQEKDNDIKRKAFLIEKKKLFCRSGDNTYYIKPNQWNYVEINDIEYLRKDYILVKINECNIIQQENMNIQIIPSKEK